jgi:hypothetical protein
VLLFNHDEVGNKAKQKKHGRMKMRTWAIAITNKNWTKPVFFKCFTDEKTAREYANNLKSQMQSETIWIDYIRTERWDDLESKNVTLSADELAVSCLGIGNSI